MKRVVVYCSSNDDLPLDWQRGARLTGEWIGRHGAQLIYGGVDSGLMRVTAGAAKEAGAEVVGIVPGRRRMMSSRLNDIVVPTSDLNDRKGVMQMLGDIFVVLPGGYGTLDEFTTSFSYLNFTHQKRPIVVFNADGVFDHILAQFNHCMELGLMPQGSTDIIHEARTPEQLIQILDSLSNS